MKHRRHMSCRADMHPRNLRFGDKGLKPAQFPILKEGIFRPGKEIKIPPFLKGGREDFSAEAYTVGTASRSVVIGFCSLSRFGRHPPRGALRYWLAVPPPRQCGKVLFPNGKHRQPGRTGMCSPAIFWLFTVMSTWGLDFCPKIQNRLRVLRGERLPLSEVYLIP